MCPPLSTLVTSQIAIPWHDLFWSTRFCISWTHWIHAVHSGLRLNVSWDFYGYRAKVSRLHIVNDNLKGIRNRAKENIFSLTKHFTFDSRRVISSLVPHSVRLHVRLICNTAHIWVLLGSRLEKWVERENHINLSSYQNLLPPRLPSDPSSRRCSLSDNCCLKSIFLPNKRNWVLNGTRHDSAFWVNRINFSRNATLWSLESWFPGIFSLKLLHLFHTGFMHPIWNWVEENCTHKVNLIAKPSSFNLSLVQPCQNEIIDPVSKSEFGTRLKLREQDLNSFLHYMSVRGLGWYDSDRHWVLEWQRQRGAFCS